MAYSFNETVATPGQLSVPVPFPYLSKTHVKLTVNGAVPLFTWTSAFTLGLDEALLGGELVRIERITPSQDPAVIFGPGTLTSSNLNQLSLQLIYVNQEALDRATDVLRVDPLTEAWDGKGKRLGPIADPIDDLDAANKRYIERVVAFLAPPASTDYTPFAPAIARPFGGRLSDRWSIYDFIPFSQQGSIRDGVSLVDVRDKFNTALASEPRIDVPRGRFMVDGPIVSTRVGQGLYGAGGQGGHTKIVGTSTSGPLIQLKDRSPLLSGIALDADATRYASTDPTARAILYGGDDSPDDAAKITSRQTLRDVIILRGPGDGIHSRFGIELTEWDDVTIQDVKGHSIVVDDGSTSGTTNRGPNAPFHWHWNRVRAIESGGHALVLGNGGSPHNPIGFSSRNFEALGCLWDPSKRIGGLDFMVLCYSHGAIFNSSDMEDQQYANTVTAAGNPRYAKAQPSKALYATQRTYLLHPFFSSVAQSAFFASGQGHRVILPRIFAGDSGAPAQAVAFEAGAGVTDFYGEFETAHTPGATQLVKLQSLSSSYKIDGETYLGTTPTASDMRLATSGTPSVGTITGGIATEVTADLMQYNAQSDTAPVDSVSRITRASLAGPCVPTRLIAQAGETLTYVSGTPTSGVNYGLDLGAASRVVSSGGGETLTLVFDPKTSRFKEVGYKTANSDDRGRLVASLAYNPPSLAAGAAQQTIVAVPGARIGDFARATFSLANGDIIWDATITGVDEAVVTERHVGVSTASNIDLGPGTLRVIVDKGA